MPAAFDFVAAEADGLGKSPIWDAASGVLYWADALAPHVRALNPKSGETRDWAMPSPDRLAEQDRALIRLALEV